MDKNADCLVVAQLRFAQEEDLLVQFCVELQVLRGEAPLQRVNEELISMADGELYIPMYGMIQSFNVSVASAIILSEACRQREAAGFYDSPRLEPDELERRLALWLEK